MEIKDSVSCDSQNLFSTSALANGRYDGRVRLVLISLLGVSGCLSSVTIVSPDHCNTDQQLKVTDRPPVRILTSVWLRPAGAQSYVVVSKVGSLRDTTGLVTIMRFLLYTRRPPPPLTLAVKWEQGESASRRPIRWSSSMSLPGVWSTMLQLQVIQAFLHSGGTGQEL